MKRIGAVAIKEFKQVFRDPLSLAMLIALPVFMLVLFGYALDFDVESVRLAVEDRDLSRASRQLVTAFTDTGKFEIVAALPAGSDIALLTERREARAILVIPEEYGAELEAGGTAQAQFILDGTDSTTASSVVGYVTGIVGAINAGQLREGLRRRGEQRFSGAGIRFETRVWYNPELESSHFLVPGLIAFIMMLTAVLSTALAVVRESERGTLEQLRVAPLGTFQILIGKTLPYLLISLIGVVLILLGARILFGVIVRGSYLDLWFATLLFLVGGLGWGLLVSTLANSQAHAFQISIFTALLPTILLSGFIFPIRNMPVALQWLTYAVPARYYLVILRGIVLKGASLSPYWPQLVALGLYATAVIGLATLRFVRRTR
ncbi:MAG: ABC transporter permease [Acidobacteriota bacterium]|nr:MAG: ABC transporter permease [Acidobacteriota bacterium]